MGKQALLDGITKEPKAVYFVWTRTGHRPRYAHPTRQRAVAEASPAAGAEAETAQAVAA